MELTRPFAENGDRQDFPVDTQGDGTMSLQQGFGAFYGLPPEEGGLFIDRTKFNQLMYLTTKGVIDNKTAIELLQNNYNSLLTGSAKLLTQNLTWTVGSGGDYDNLQAAINEASKYLNYGNFTITINLKQGFILSENIFLFYKDLSFVKITSSDSEVSVSRSLSGSLFSIDYATSPIFNIKLNLSQNSSLNNIFNVNYSKIYFKGPNSGILNSKCSIFTGWCNYIITAGATFTGCSGESVFKVYFSNINSEAADFSNFTGSILATSIANSKIDLTASKYTNCNPSTYLLNVGYYGIIIAFESKKTGLQGIVSNITPNQWNANGVILYS